MFPTVESLTRTNTLIRLIDRQRVQHATPPTALTLVDPQPLLDAGFTAEEIEKAIAHQHGWERFALEEFGRIGRDPERMAPALTRLGEVWRRHSAKLFTELVTEVASMPPRGPSLFGMEEPAFLERLEAWAAAAAEGSGASEEADEDRSRWIGSFLARFLRRWALEPDARFGQMVVNIGGLGRPREQLVDVTDEEFLELLSAR